MKLTVRGIAALKPRERAYLAPDGRGLYLKVQPGGSKSWLLRYMLAGKSHDVGLGTCPEIGLAEARDRATGLRRLKADGVDPLAQRKAERLAAMIADATAMTFGDCAEAYIASHRAGWGSPKSEISWRHTLDAFALPVIGKLPVAAVDTGLVTRIIEPIWQVTPETASRLRGRIEAILDYAKVRGWRTGENPARWRGHLDHVLPSKGKVRKVEHHPALPYPELPAFLAELRGRAGLAARALEFAILTAARTGEVLGATWPEIDLEARVWAIPGSRMKGKREHRVPLSEPAAAILAGLERKGEKVFPITGAAVKKLRQSLRPGVTTHGFRASFSTWGAESGIDRDLVEMALSHTVGTAVERAYQRSDMFERRRGLADAWGRYCGGRT